MNTMQAVESTNATKDNMMTDREVIGALRLNGYRWRTEGGVIQLHSDELGWVPAPHCRPDLYEMMGY